MFARRMDDQLKLNGFRIELSEIENVFTQHAMVEQSVALVRNGMLILYVKSVRDVVLQPKDIQAIRDEASKSLPYYMMPT